MGTTESKILDNNSIIEFSFYIEPIVSNENDEINIDDLSHENIEKIKNYYDSKYFIITFEKALKNDFLKYKINSILFENNTLFFNGNILLKYNDEHKEKNISFTDIEEFITNSIELNKDNLLLKINNNNINYNISFDKDYMSNIDFEFKTIEKENNNNGLSKKVKIIKPRRKNESYEKEKIINRNIKIKKVIIKYVNDIGKNIFHPNPIS